MNQHAMSKYSVTVVFALACVAQTAMSQQKTSERTRKAKARKRNSLQVEVYKTIGDVKLTMRIFTPPGHSSKDKRPAIVFFFGGGWRGGSPSQFTNHCRYFASRGMVAMTADYRVYGRHRAKVIDCVADATSALRWIRGNASRLGIDPQRIAAGGGSAGGHLAAAVGTLSGFDTKGEDSSISARPNALVLFNPALDLTADGFSQTFRRKRYAAFAARCGTEPENISPTRQVKKGVPPAIIFHGKNDTTVPYAQAVQFEKVMKQAGNRCVLVGFKGEAHGFFNYGRKRNKYFAATLREADRFLASLGYLQGEPTIDRFLEESDSAGMSQKPNAARFPALAELPLKVFPASNCGTFRWYRPRRAESPKRTAA